MLVCAGEPVAEGIAERRQAIVIALTAESVPKRIYDWMIDCTRTC